MAPSSAEANMGVKRHTALLVSHYVKIRLLALLKSNQVAQEEGVNIDRLWHRPGCNYTAVWVD